MENFRAHWERLSEDPEGQHEFIKLIVERAHVEDEKIVAMTLRSNYHLVLGHKTNGPTYLKVDPMSYMDGSDWIRALTYIIVIFLPKHIPLTFHFASVINQRRHESHYHPIFANF